ncbi:MAG TPA: hypothetical protein PLC89_21565 [Haliscomenobacter sp.]|uniref:hypothetical protein n=1 Tax=Haliscomenobacter sp. TaxID=2717303 RepID=UPI002CB605A5|nr:hypothetical protein [Haliscomenobacter sp.]HOY19916.1 hypothetical protein [Haliscomenobacter sp.]HPH17901.1 hypothetical protein [Haliscomenobacter sp.]
MPFILLAFSNKQDNYLEYLKKETSELRRILLGLQDKLEYEIISNATTEDLFDAMTAFHDQVTVFHYGGHADSLYLELENRPQGIEQFVQLLKGMANLQIIFLNGCSTQGMVSKILEGLGRDIAVIATSSKIDDQRAFNFSKAFYTSFTQENQTLSGAFEMAKSVLDATDIQNTQFRESVPRKTGDTPAALMPWGVYGKMDFTQQLQLVKAAPIPEVPSKPSADSLDGFKNQLKKMVALGDIDQALELAEQKFGLIDILVAIMSRWSRHKKDIQKGNILPGSDSAKLEENRIGNNFTAWVENLDEDDWK